MRLTGAEFDAALEAVADFTDVKSAYTIGHSRGVADLAGEAARIVGLGSQAAALVRRAGLVHDLGRLGVPNTVWDKPRRLTHAETERVRLHPYLTERMLVCSPALAPLALIAVQRHERLDGSGYPRGISGGAGEPGRRVLAAADFYRSRTEPRPHRPAGAAEEAAVQLQAEARAGRMDGEAVAAALSAAGHRATRRPASQAGRSKCSGCSPEACRVGKSPSVWSSRARRPAVLPGVRRVIVTGQRVFVMPVPARDQLRGAAAAPGRRSRGAGRACRGLSVPAGARPR